MIRENMATFFNCRGHKIISWQCLLIFIAAFYISLSPVHAENQFSEVDIVPAAKKISIDGKLKDWNQNSLIETIFLPSFYPNYSLRIGFMYDAKGIYVGVHVVDSTPMLNNVNPAAELYDGSKSDALVIDLISKPINSLSNKTKVPGNQICRLTIWHSTLKKEPVLDCRYGKEKQSSKTYRGSKAYTVFKKDADKKGYSFESFVSWERLNFSKSDVKKILKGGETISFSINPVWGNSDGTAPMISYREISSNSEDLGISSWGIAKFAKTGKVAPRPNPLLAGGGADLSLNPLKIKLKLDDPKAKTISLGIFSKEKGLIRSLPVAVRKDSQLGADFELAWDGLDADGKPILPGTYQLKQLTHQGIGQKFIASLHNSGNPPWKTDDGLGQWGGDWAPPLAAASDKKCVYLGWASGEAGTTLVCVKKELDKNDIYQKVWAAHPTRYDDVGSGLTALAADGKRLFVAQDGTTYSGKKIKGAKSFAAVTLYDSKTGQTLKFPFGKSSILVTAWDKSRVKDYKQKPLFECRKTKDFGPQQFGINLTGIAVAGDRLYATLFLDNKVISYNWKTGRKLKEFSADAPSSVVVDAKGKLIVATGKGLLWINPENSEKKILTSKYISRPWGITIDKSGNLLVADCGSSMQVKVFSPEGKLLRAVGKPGGRAWVGTYDPSGMLMPAGITVDADGKLWVTENDEFPRRVSVWDKKGKNVGDFHGPCVPQTDRAYNPENPNRINAQMVEYELDYDTGKYKCISTLWRPHVDGWTPVSNFGRASRILIRNVNGKQYGFLDHGYADRLGVIFIRKGDRFQACSSLGYGTGVPLAALKRGENFGNMIDAEKWLGPEKWKTVWNSKKKAYYSGNQIWHTWVDDNADGIVQAKELKLERRPWSDKQVYRVNGVDDDLTLWGVLATNDVARIPVKKFTKDGVPVYPGRKEVKSLFTKLSRTNTSIWMDSKKQRIYGFEAKGGDRVMRGEYAGVSCYDFSGKLLWMYRDTWLGFASDAPFWKPGLIIGVNKFIGQADLDNGVGLLVMPGYYGNYSMISTDGLWVHSFCKDKRLGGGAGPDTVFIENMTGIFYRNAKNGKVYLIGGDIDARVWEVTGLESIRTSETALSVTPQDFEAAKEVAQRVEKVVAKSPLQLHKAEKIAVDGNTSDWNFKGAVDIDAGVGRTAKVALAYDDKYLYAAFKVNDRSPMANNSTDPALLFKGGDVCDIMLATNLEVDQKRKKPALGDTRLSFAVFNNKPVCVVYQAKSTGKKFPKTFSSPTGQEVFERVQVLEDAKVAIQRTANGYELEAAVPLSAIGFKPLAGKSTMGDVGVLFGTDGGGITILRSYYSNKDTMVVEDVPSEARLAPANWTILEVK